MRKPSRRLQVAAALVGVLVLAAVAAALASGGQPAGDEDFEVDSAEPASGGAGAVVVPPATGDGGGANPGSRGAGNPAATGPDAPVSSDDTPPPSPTIVPDPPAAFSGIRSFEDCAAAGYPVMESYPEQCRTPDGRLFVRVID